MTREQAEQVAERRRAEAPQDAWLVRGGDDVYEVVRLRGLGRGPTVTTSEARPRPPHADDPRTAGTRDVPPYAAGG